MPNPGIEPGTDRSSVYRSPTELIRLVKDHIYKLNLFTISLVAEYYYYLLHPTNLIHYNTFVYKCNRV